MIKSRFGIGFRYYATSTSKKKIINSRLNQNVKELCFLHQENKKPKEADQDKNSWGQCAGSRG